MVKVLFVCLGNICRSPTAEGVFRDLIQKEGKSGQIETDSAGTGNWHIGHPPDKRAQKAASQRGVDLSDLRARQVHVNDFETFDYILAMDQNNYQDLMAQCPKEFEDRVHLFLSFDPQSPEKEVPDPYFGGPAGFDYVLDLVEEASNGLMKSIAKSHF